MPLQHINDRMLKSDEPAAHRAADRGDHRAGSATAIPGLVLRTTFIVGFPGETEAEFEELLDFVQTARFERLGVFPYSFEPDTPAARLPEHLPEEVKAERRDRVMAAQQPIAFDWSLRQIGREFDVLIDGPDPDMTSLMIGRGHADSPEIDAVVRVKGKKLGAGDIVRVKLPRRMAMTWPPRRSAPRAEIHRFADSISASAANINSASPRPAKVRISVPIVRGTIASNSVRPSRVILTGWSRSIIRSSRRTISFSTPCILPMSTVCPDRVATTSVPF